jgi:CRP-like cAMP-binding protein
MHAGELGLEMYFIIEGKVDIVSANGDKLATLTEGKPLGEMALLDINPSVRGASAICQTNMSLAVLSIEDFKFAMEMYPEFNKQVKLQAEKRQSENDKKLEGTRGKQ